MTLLRSTLEHNHPLSIAKRLWPLASLALLMILTRPHPMSGLIHLADASAVIFFLGGFLQLQRRILLGLIGLSVLLDYISIQFFGTSDFCVSRAYGALWLGYSILWFSGRFIARAVNIKKLRITQFAFVLAAFLASRTVSYAISSGAFYYFSGRFPSPTIIEMFLRLQRYLPAPLLSGFIYLAAYLTLTVIYQQRKQFFKKGFL